MKKGLKMGLGICGLAMCGLIGASVVKGAWDNLHQEKSVSVSIGSATNLSNVSITGGDLNKTLVPSGATLGTNDVEKLFLGTLTYSSTANISEVDLSFDVFSSGVLVDENLFSIETTYENNEGDSIGDSDYSAISSNCKLYLVLNKNSSNITDSERDSISGKTLSVVLNLEGIKA